MRLVPSFLRREFVEPGTEVSLQTQIASFWEETRGVGVRWSPNLVDRVWAANRCMQSTCQQLAQMPLRFYGPPSASQPAWVSNPDPVWFPNGIGDAVFAAAWNMYAHGSALLYVTAFYATGFPSNWTVLDSAHVTIGKSAGRRSYKVGDRELDPDLVVQIDRDPRGGMQGTSALQAFAAANWNLILATEASNDIISSAPPVVLKSAKKLTREQAERIQGQWAERAAQRRSGRPPVLDPDLSLESTDLGLSPKDLLLLDSQHWDASTIAAAFGMPSLMLNIALQGSLVYQAPGQLFDYWIRNELYPRSKQIHNALTTQMLPAGQSVQFDQEEIRAPDLKDKAEVWTKAFEDGLVTRDEWRAVVLRLPPQSEPESLDDLLQPPVAVASSSGNVQPLRPTTEVTA